MEPSIACTLGLSSPHPFDPQVISERTGLVMDQGGIAGEPVVWPNGLVAPEPRKRSLWTHWIEPRRTLDMDGVLQEMLDRVEAVREPFSVVRSELADEAWISLHVHMEEGYTPNGTISVTNMAGLASLDVTLDLDLYCSQP